MNWDAVGAVGESLGSIAVFITLIYLAVQVRRTRREVQRSVSQNRRETFRQLNQNRLTNERLNQLSLKASAALGVGADLHPFVSALVDQTELTPEDATTLLWDQWAWWSYRAQVIPYISELTDGERKEFDAGARVYGEHPVFRLWFETMKRNLDPDAVGYVERLVSNTR